MTAVMLGLGGAVTPAAAQVNQGIHVVVKISADPSVGGTAIGAATGTINGVPVTLNEASWSDTHAKQSPLFEGGIAIAAGRAMDILALFNYGHAGGNANVIVGSVGGTPINANFDDYNFFGAEAGIRLRRSSGLGPYAMVAGGFRRISAIDARLFTTSAVTEVTGYEASVVPTFAFGGGVLFGDRNLSLGLEIGVRYAGAPKAASNLGVTPVSGAGSRWSLPVGIVFMF